VDTNSALSLGTVHGRTHHEGGTLFEARARVVYSRASQGMGLVFTAIEPEQFRTLETWLAESREPPGSRQTAEESASIGDNAGSNLPGRLALDCILKKRLRRGRSVLMVR